MKLKMNYQYTYFIYPYIVKEDKYRNYILRLLRNNKLKIKTFEKEKDLLLYKYFTPKVREFLFSSFSMPHSKVKKLLELPIETRAAAISQFPCTILEYQLDKDIKRNNKDKSGISFKIKKLEVICFNTGICFIVIKTNIENSDEFSDLVNFNYKFREISQEDSLSSNDNINITLENMEGTKSLIDIIKDIVGSSIQTVKLGINTEKFLTYSYVCIDGRMWNQDNNFDSIKNNYIKYANLLPIDNNSNIKDKSTTISAWKYAKLGITKTATILFTSNIEMNNFTILPDEFENQYFYTYILNLYKRIYLKKINYEFMNAENYKQIQKTRKKFVDFTQKLWIQEVTEEEIGNILNERFKNKFEIENTYYKMKNKYDILYKEMNIEKNSKRIKYITFILIVTLIFNILNFVILLR